MCFDENLIVRGSVWDHFLQSTLAREAVWVDFFKKEFGIRVRLTAEKSTNGGNRTSARGIGHLLVQNRSQEVQEHFGSRGKAKNSKNKLKNRDFGVYGSGGYRTPDLRPLKGRCYW